MGKSDIHNAKQGLFWFADGTNSLNSAVTGHRVPLPAEMSQVSQPVRLGDKTIL